MNGYRVWGPLLLVAAGILSGCSSNGRSVERGGFPEPDTLRLPQEVHLKNVRQLTFDGENAEAYFSPDGKELVFQATRPPYECDQIFRFPTSGGEPRLVSTGSGRTTCAFFLPDGESILFSSTHHVDAACPPRPDFSQGYVWAVYSSFDIFVRDRGGDLRQLTTAPGYDAEATVSPRGDRIVFTSARDGDLDLYTMNVDGTDVVRITKTVGYEGGGFFSPDGRRIVYRASAPQGVEATREFKELLSRDLIRPSVLNIYTIDARGGEPHLVLENGAANFAPYFLPDGERIIFSSNLGDPAGRNFDLYVIRQDGSGLERITYHPSFDGFPMFSPDGRYLVFASNRYNRKPRDTNVFIGEWIE